MELITFKITSAFLFVIPFASSLPKIKLLHAFNRTVDGLHDAQFELGFFIYFVFIY